MTRAIVIANATARAMVVPAKPPRAAILPITFYILTGAGDVLVTESGDRLRA